MSVFSTVSKLKLLNWSVVRYGFHRGFLSREDIARYAADCLQISDDIDGHIAELSAAIYLEKQRIVVILDRVATSENTKEKTIKDIWRLGFLLDLLEEDESATSILSANEWSYAADKVDEIDRLFCYPADMLGISRYGEGKGDTLVEARKLANAMKARIFEEWNHNCSLRN